MAKLAPLHPGEVLREEFLVPMGLSAYALADRCHVPRTRIERIVNEENSISADTALRLAKALGTTPEFWLNLQARYAVEVTRPKISRELATIEAPKVAA
ncbi:transcriptional regulator [Bradyrhizobium sacchari]|uniref:XRE family plasmid maintenance system antidote protein n=1 Tax=Bradyrhizobium sacchari TaxID=1399419 RepID=A0A560JCJ2_9BRAD|nr:HigA family addiction module antitoxin [Bradyrhizobium sacchari]OPY93584.1 transcriptional regulator [Bradyrhizobium sacchari]TWB50879.1 XRE family plasmid maintenance system antidote protein [Bradyrhizobium sacchari]TWB68913.1 XRE family plasmid maintenance system antidote protein [Bradyrhizobium sacchari]